MERKITIRNLKHIRELSFDIPAAGVHLLAGSNGAGKTSVLACLRRIGQRQAFAHHFAASQHSRALDNFEGAEIIYTLDNRSVTYAYGGERWVPRPRSNSRLLDEFGYPAVLYIGATADRITPRPEDFNPRRLTQAPTAIRDAANRIFGTDKFNTLKTINLTTGFGNPAFVMQFGNAANVKYVSERNFSLGELCILKLVRELMNCAESSLILIDELELALHPRAQIELLNYLIEISTQKRLTVIFSTHSVSLLKRVRRSNMLFLESNNGIISILKGCYPTYALGNMASDEERAPDVVIYVEDEAALYVTDALKDLCIATRFNQQGALFPTVHVIPIGPFISVVRFLERSDAFLPPSTTSAALLDLDVKDENLRDWQTNRQYPMLAEFQRHENRIRYLPWTPEVGLIEFLRGNGTGAEREIRQHFNDQRLSIRTQDIGNIPGNAGKEQRDACKSAVSRVIKHLTTYIQNTNEEQVRRGLFRVFAKWYFDNNQNTIMELLGPLVAGR